MLDGDITSRKPSSFSICFHLGRIEASFYFTAGCDVICPPDPFAENLRRCSVLLDGTALRLRPAALIATPTVCHVAPTCDPSSRPLARCTAAMRGWPRCGRSFRTSGTSTTWRPQPSWRGSRGTPRASPRSTTTCCSKLTSWCLQRQAICTTCWCGFSRVALLSHQRLSLCGASDSKNPGRSLFARHDLALLLDEVPQRTRSLRFRGLLPLNPVHIGDAVS